LFCRISPTILLTFDPATLPPGLSSSEPANGELTTSNDNDLDLGKYGTNGLSSLLKMEQNDYTAFSIGQDITKFGLDLSLTSSILKEMASPWIETSRSDVEPYFTLPQSILPENINPPPGLCDNKIQSFSDETLFYIFYMKPRDTLQEYAARELVARNWRYHKDIQVWLTKDSNVEPVLVSQDVERGVYIFFDPHNWEKIKKEFVLHYSSVQA
jgi:CCR4-NOT transcription complex subunit 2